MKPHFIIYEGNGALYDTRTAESSKLPLRRDFCLTHQEIETLAQLKATLRNGRFAWPGAYSMFLIMGDNEPATFDAVKKEWREIVGAFLSGDKRDQWRVIGCAIHWEGAPLICCISGAEIESAYGEPEAEETESEASK